MMKLSQFSKNTVPFILNNKYLSFFNNSIFNHGVTVFVLHVLLSVTRNESVVLKQRLKKNISF
jgi:hypothetical protein